MADFSGRQFGLLIAYLLPGFIALAGVAPLIPAVNAWLQPGHSGGESVGPPIYALLAATAAGMLINCFRWLIVDSIHHRTGAIPPAWDDARLGAELPAFDYLVANHYRYYQFYAGTLVALAFVYPVHRILRTLPLLGLGTDLGALVIGAVLFAGSRDALAKYYTRTRRLIGDVAEKGSRGASMTNGNHVSEGAGSQKSSGPRANGESKPDSPAKREGSKPKPATAESK